MDGKGPWYTPVYYLRNAVTIFAESRPLIQVARSCVDAPIDWGTLDADMVGAGTITWASEALATPGEDKFGGHQILFLRTCKCCDHRSDLPLQSSTVAVACPSSWLSLLHVVMSGDVVQSPRPFPRRIPGTAQSVTLEHSIFDRTASLDHVMRPRCRIITSISSMHTQLAGFKVSPCCS